MGDEKKGTPMTRADLAEVTDFLVGMNPGSTAGHHLARVLTEVHRLRLKTRLQRRTIAEGLATPEHHLSAHGQEDGLRRGKLEMLDAMDAWLNTVGHPGPDMLADWVANRREKLG